VISLIPPIALVELPPYGSGACYVTGVRGHGAVISLVPRTVTGYSTSQSVSRALFAVKGTPRECEVDI